VRMGLAAGRSDSVQGHAYNARSRQEKGRRRNPDDSGTHRLLVTLTPGTVVRFRPTVVSGRHPPHRQGGIVIRAGSVRGERRYATRTQPSRNRLGREPKRVPNLPAPAGRL
jgi:hypothetical protein